RQHEINALLVARGRAGGTVVRLKGGDPFVFGRGGEEAEALRDAGVPWEVVPGVSSAVAVPAYAGVPVTHRGLSTSVTVVTGHVGDPTAPGGVDWEALGRAGGTLVVLMGMATRGEIARRLLAAGRPPHTPVAVIEWGTTPRQRSVRTSLAELGGADLGSPAVIVVGPVAGLDLGRPGGHPLAGRAVVVTRPRHQAGRLVEALVAAGARPVELPVIDVAEPEDGGAAARRAAAGVGDYGWVAFTSANAVHRFLAWLRDARSLGGVQVAAVGEATTAALAAHGVVADLVGATATAEGLASAFPRAGGGPGPGRAGTRRVLFPRAAGAREALPAGLAAKGWTVDEVVVYRTVPAAAPAPEVVAEVASADAVTFASPSAVRAYLALRTAADLPLTVPPVVACIGPVTAAAARRQGLAVTVEAGSPSVADLVAALSAHLGPGDRPGAGAAGPGLGATPAAVVEP
ncbi:MAG: uroporphyrinogen-III C-methyltransferase, partial [Acidimicrobiales bacterium]